MKTLCGIIHGLLQGLAATIVIIVLLVASPLATLPEVVEAMLDITRALSGGLLCM